MLRVICAWCGKDLGSKEGEPVFEYNITMTICAECEARLSTCEKSGSTVAEPALAPPEAEVAQPVPSAGAAPPLAVPVPPPASTALPQTLSRV